ncbi:MAG: hypothetical protein KGZ62_01695 [Sulfurimonas sp.]|nr:hypothetical protein [Sulfurimonas sp.]
MSLAAAVKNILRNASRPLSPQELRDAVKNQFPECYGTESHQRNVRNWNYQNLDHALLAQIYTLSRTASWIVRDTSVSPMLLSYSINPPPQVSQRPTTTTANAHGVRRRDEDFSGKVEDILRYAVEYHDAFYAADTFKGPSLYFHRRALEAASGESFTKYLEYIYAVLTSWGMHRMGSGGSKMQDFETFRLSVEPLRTSIRAATDFKPEEMTEREWGCLKEIFISINVMASGTTIVGNSKVMHHLLPNIVPPIDREYTLWFLKGNGTIRNDLESEWAMMREIISGFFMPISQAEPFNALANEWMSHKELYPWDTSIMKIIDSLIIGAKALSKTGVADDI